MPTLKPLTTLVPAGLVLAGFAWHLAHLKPVAEFGRDTAELQKLVPGAAFTLPSRPGFWALPLPRGVLLARVATAEVARQEVDLCAQRRGRDGVLLPLRVGRTWQELTAQVEVNRSSGRPAHAGLKNWLLDTGPGGLDIPALEVGGRALPGFVENPGEPLRVELQTHERVWSLSDSAPRPVFKEPQGDGRRAFYRDFWMVWEPAPAADGGDGPGQPGAMAVHLERYEHPRCEAGMLRVSLHRSLPQAPAGRTWPVRFYPDPVYGELQRTDLRLASGDYRVPEAPPPLEEDAELFARARKAGLIRLDPDGWLQLAPRDLGLAHRLAGPNGLLNGSLAAWSGVAWDDTAGELHEALYGTYAGQYVRRQVARFNRERLLAALRPRPANAAMRRLLAKGGSAWTVRTAGGAPLSLTGRMPVQAGRLVDGAAVGWQPWVRVASWPAGTDPAAGLRFRLALPAPARGDERIRILVLGSHPEVSEGALVVVREGRCLDGPCNKAPFAELLLLDLRRGAEAVEIAVKPQVRRRAGELWKAEFRHIVLEDGRVSWRRDLQRRDPVRARVIIDDAAGRPLWSGDGISEPARRAGLLPLLGMGPGFDASLSGNLARLGDFGLGRAEARLTLELPLQAAAQGAVEQRLKALDGDRFAARRRSALVVLDADTGAVLAAGSGPRVRQGLDRQELVGYEIKDAAHSPLRVHGWQHDGGVVHAPGSTFKLIDALLLEQLAPSDPDLERLLDGVKLAELDRVGRLDGHDFRSDDGCYPSRHENCPWGVPAGARVVHRHGPVISNYGRKGVFYETPKREMGRNHDTRYGLEQALRDSLNTWFSWLFERTDGTGLGRGDIPGIAHTRALVDGALDGVRPIDPLLRRLGFGAPLALDGDLFPASFPWRAWDVLQGTPSRLDPILDRHGLRQMAIGLRMQSTPLQMALVSASIAGGRLIRPRLLARLNEREAVHNELPALDICTDRIKAGMKRVPVDGTAKQAFGELSGSWRSGSRQEQATRREVLERIRERLYAKTGTAPVTLAGHKVNTAWLTGWLEPGAIPGESRRLAFGCVVSHVNLTGGGACGPLVADYLLRLAVAPRAHDVVESRTRGDLPL